MVQQGLEATAVVGTPDQQRGSGLPERSMVQAAHKCPLWAAHGVFPWYVQCPMVGTHLAPTSLYVAVHILVQSAPFQAHLGSTLLTHSLQLQAHPQIQISA